MQLRIARSHDGDPIGQFRNTEIGLGLAEAIAQQANTLDENRPAAIERRRKTNQRTARKDGAHFVDPGLFLEYGSLATGAQWRRPPQELKNAPADGFVTGVATVNADQFGPERCMMVAYAYRARRYSRANDHKKINRMLTLSEQWRMLLVLYALAGGGRPDDTDRFGMTGFNGLSFLVSLVAAGNAAMLGSCDIYHCDEKYLDRYGWAGHDQGRLPSCLSSCRSRPALFPVCEQRHRHPGPRSSTRSSARVLQSEMRGALCQRHGTYGLSWWLEIGGVIDPASGSCPICAPTQCPTSKVGERPYIDSC